MTSWFRFCDARSTARQPGTMMTSGADTARYQDFGLSFSRLPRFYLHYLITIINIVLVAVDGLLLCFSSRRCLCLEQDTSICTLRGCLPVPSESPFLPHLVSLPPSSCPRWKQSHFYFYDNFGKCGPISNILSLLHLVINCGRGRSKRCHLTSYLLPHYLVKFGCYSLSYRE